MSRIMVSADRMADSSSRLMLSERSCARARAMMSDCREIVDANVSGGVRGSAAGGKLDTGDSGRDGSGGSGGAAVGPRLL